jgi:hypothetical protein
MAEKVPWTSIANPKLDSQGSAAALVSTTCRLSLHCVSASINVLFIYLRGTIFRGFVWLLSLYVIVVVYEGLPLGTTTQSVVGSVVSLPFRLFVPLSGRAVSLDHCILVFFLLF